MYIYDKGERRFFAVCSLLCMVTTCCLGLGMAYLVGAGRVSFWPGAMAGFVSCTLFGSAGAVLWHTYQREDVYASTPAAREFLIIKEIATTTLRAMMDKCDRAIYRSDSCHATLRIKRDFVTGGWHVVMCCDGQDDLSYELSRESCSVSLKKGGIQPLAVRRRCDANVPQYYTYGGQQIRKRPGYATHDDMWNLVTVLHASDLSRAPRRD